MWFKCHTCQKQQNQIKYGGGGDVVQVPKNVMDIREIQRMFSKYASGTTHTHINVLYNM